MNLASRLVALAEPDTVVADAETARRLGDGSVESLGAREVAGFDRPVDVFAIR